MTIINTEFIKGKWWSNWIEYAHKPGTTITFGVYNPTKYWGVETIIVWYSLN
jgi:hypothetical protein